jgi:ABC-type uncharacterized transport system substrate-binding protein
MRRREFVRLFSSTVVAWPLTARAQQPTTKMPQVGWIVTGSPASHRFSLAAFQDGMNALGYVEGKNINFEYRWAEGNLARLPDLANDLVQQKANDLGTTLYDARDLEELKNVLFKIDQSDSDFMTVLNDPFVFTYRKIITDAANQRKLPAIYGFREFVDDGGLISYAASLTESYRRAAGYVDQILKGAKPANLPVELPSKFELVVNLKTAKALGLTIGRDFLLRADDVVE